jgi:peptidoglycan/LPS O-acetylase OafA/YrhL
VANHRFYTLDAMRGIAAIAVVCLHASQQLGSPEPYYSYLAVDFFFILSGFVLSRIYETPLRRGLQAREFLRNRFLRLYPLFAAGIILGTVSIAAIIQAGDPTSPHARGLIFAAVMNFLILPDPVSLSLFPVNPPSWSLFLEFAVNFAFAYFLSRLSTRKLALVCAAAACVFSHEIVIRDSASFGTQWADLALGVVRALYGFTAGMLIARREKKIDSTPSWWSLAIILVLSTVLFSPSFYIPKGVYLVAAIFIALPVILSVGTRCEIPTALVPVAKSLGDISYPLYALHFPLLILFSKFVKIEGASALWSAIGFVVLSSILAWIAALYLDAPLRRWLVSRRLPGAEAAMRA